MRYITALDSDMDRFQVLDMRDGAFADATTIAWTCTPDHADLICTLLNLHDDPSSEEATERLNRIRVRDQVALSPIPIPGYSPR